MRFSSKHIFLLVFTILFNVPFCKATSQVGDTTKITNKNRLDVASVEWISQWPGKDLKSNENAIKPRIKDLIFGKKDLLQLVRPVSILAINQNSFWILDQENKTIFQVTDAIGKIPRFIEKKNNSFSSLVAICKFQGNDMLFTDSYSNKIFKINTENKKITSFNDSLKLNKPTGIAYSALRKEIWVVETGTHRLIVLNEKGELIKTIGSRGLKKGQFNFPTHIWIDKQGNVYVVDAMNFRVQVLNQAGDVISVFGSNGNATGFFSCPKGIATDSYGHIYIVDAMFHAIQVFDINGEFLYTFGSQGHDEGQFWMPSGIFIDESDKIYVADSYNSRIQIFQLVGGSKK